MPISIEGNVIDWDAVEGLADRVMQLELDNLNGESDDSSFAFYPLTLDKFEHHVDKTVRIADGSRSYIVVLYVLREEHCHDVLRDKSEVCTAWTLLNGPWEHEVWIDIANGVATHSYALSSWMLIDGGLKRGLGRPFKAD
jgi:hypothetical protein